MKCKNCGSQNHNEGDCSKLYNGWKERHVAPMPTTVITEISPDREIRRSLIGSSLTKRKGFPFLREETRRSIDERIAMMTAPKPEMTNQSPETSDRGEYKKPDYNPPKLAKQVKANKKTINTKQELLF